MSASTSQFTTYTQVPFQRIQHPLLTFLGSRHAKIMDKIFSTTDFLIISYIIFVSVIAESLNKISKGLIPV